jgi:RPA family protein
MEEKNYVQSPNLSQGQSDNPNIKRLTAHKILIKDILKYKYVKEEGWNPNYIITPNGNISKVNIFGFIISNENNNLLIDDSTGSIQIRSFEENNNLSNFNMGDLVLVVGKPREFNNTKYITPDLIKKYDDPTWLKLRIKELNNSYEEIVDDLIIKEEEKQKETIKTLIIENTNPTNKTYSDEPNSLINTVDEELTDYEIILQLIEKNDDGQGVSIDQIIAVSKIENCEKLLNTLLQNGEIFELRPGIVKVL